MSYVVRVGDRGGVFRSFEERTFDLVLKRYAECMGEWPDKVLTVHNEERYDAEWVDDRWVVDDGMTDEEKEALDAVREMQRPVSADRVLEVGVE